MDVGGEQRFRPCWPAVYNTWGCTRRGLNKDIRRRLKVKGSSVDRRGRRPEGIVVRKHTYTMYAQWAVSLLLYYGRELVSLCV